MKTGTSREAGGKSKRQCFALALCALLFAPSVRAEAQQPNKIPRIGLVAASGSPKLPLLRLTVSAKDYVISDILMGKTSPSNIVTLRASKNLCLIL
jgi:hypothetical protein